MCNPDTDSPRPSWRGGLCERTGPSLYRGSQRIEQEDFPKKKNTLGGTLGNSPSATAPVSSPPRHPSGNFAHRLGSVRTSSQRELRLQAPTRGGCPAIGSVPSDWGVCLPTRVCMHPLGSVCTSSQLILEGTGTTGMGKSENQGRICMHTHSPEEAYHKKRVGRSWEHQDTSWKRKPTNKGNINR